jgi:hypothetical protein
VRKVADNPYPGSRAFTQTDEEFFFGRDADIAVIVNLDDEPADCRQRQGRVREDIPAAGRRSSAAAEKTSQHRPRTLPSGNRPGPAHARRWQLLGQRPA